MPENQLASVCLESPIGPIEIIGSDQGIYQVNFLSSPIKGVSKPPETLLRCRDELDRYFKGRTKVFSVPVVLEGTAFQKGVWNELKNIPYGTTASYGAIAEAIGRPKAARAVGQANHNNPVAVIIPCHRVIGSQGKLVGYGSGLWRKEWLLKHEGAL